jgi:hypothetical protein
MRRDSDDLTDLTILTIDSGQVTANIAPAQTGWQSYRRNNRLAIQRGAIVYKESVPLAQHERTDLTLVSR